MRYILVLYSNEAKRYFSKWVVVPGGNYPQFVEREFATKFNSEEAKEHGWHLTMHGYTTDMELVR